MKTVLKITGMTCQNCVRHAREALEAVPGVTSASVDLATGIAEVIQDSVASEDLVAAIEEEGYQAQVQHE